MQSKLPCVYILASKPNGTLYVGVTADLVTRIYQHQHKQVEGVTKKYSVDILFYYEVHDEMQTAIAREKQ